MNQVDKIKLSTLAYWCFYRQHIVGAIECGDADVKTLSKSLMVTETEVKISIADMQREVKTKRHKHMRMSRPIKGLYPFANYFYFIVPEELKCKALKVCEERYPYAGLLIYKESGNDFYVDDRIICVKTPKRFQRLKPDIQEILRIGYAARNTAIRYGNKLMLGDNNGELS